MRVAVISFFDSVRFEEYPTTHSLAAMRLGAYMLKAHSEWEVRLRAFDEHGFDAGASARLLLDEGFDVVGVPAYIWTLERSRNLSEALCAAPWAPLVVIGGPETRAMEYQLWPAATVFVLGQGEEPLAWLCEKRSSDPTFTGSSLDPNVVQPIYSTTRERSTAFKHAVPDRRNRRLPHGVPLFSADFAPLLDGADIDTDFTWYETARGCIYDCSFCGHNTLPFFATFDEDFLRDEIQNLHSRGIRRLFLIDPILGGKAVRGKTILRMFREIAPDIAITAYMRPEFLDEEFVDLLVESNIQELLMGLQTTNPNVPKHVRGNNFGKIMQLVPQLAERGVPWRAELIVGLPGDDLAGLRESLRFTVDELRPWSVHAYHLTAIPETKLFQLLDRTDEDVWIKADNRLRVVSTSSYSEAELRDMLVYAGGITSRHSYLRSRDGATPSFAILDRGVREVLGDLQARSAAARAFIRMSHPAGHEVWRKWSDSVLAGDA